MNLNEAIKNIISKESFKSKQDHAFALTSRLAQTITDLKEVQRQNEGLAKARVEDKVKVDALKKELGKANKALDKAKLKLA